MSIKPKTISYQEIIKKKPKKINNLGYRTLHFDKSKSNQNQSHPALEKWVVNDARMVDGKMYLDVWLNPRYFPDNGGETTLISSNVQELTTSELSIKLT